MGGMARILFIEDELNLLGSVAFILEREGHSVTTAATGEDGLRLAAAGAHDLVLLDINLPDLSGFEVCQRLRRQPATAGVLILLLSERDGVDDIVEGLERSADDYLAKPFHPRVLLARIGALLRRGAVEPAAPAPLCFGSLAIDGLAHEARVEGVRVALTKTEFDILHLLARHPGRVLSRDQIIDAVRGESAAITERAVDFQVAGLRRKLGAAAELIETVRGVGYKLAA
jgi:two-component system, OmpR family, alkaline phosphatase synthesis response regulator PhoP